MELTSSVVKGGISWGNGGFDFEYIKDVYGFTPKQRKERKVEFINISESDTPLINKTRDLRPDVQIPSYN